MGEVSDIGSSIRAGLESARQGPARVRRLCAGLDAGDLRRKPGVGKLSLLEHVRHLLDMEREVFGSRLRRVLEEDRPRLEPLGEQHVVAPHLLEGQSFDEILAAWAAARESNTALVESTHEEQWGRRMMHPELGEATFGALVLRWCRHDAEHLRQIEILARNSQERNL